MDKKITTTIEEMKAEAAVRMKSIGIPQEYIDGYLAQDDIRTYDSSDGSSDIISELDDYVVSIYEKRFKGVVWSVIKDEYQSEEGFSCYDYYLLFVSPDKDKWEEERRDLASMCPQVYFLTYYDTDTIPPIENDEIKNCRIRLTENHGLVI